MEGILKADFPNTGWKRISQAESHKFAQATSLGEASWSGSEAIAVGLVSHGEKLDLE